MDLIRSCAELMKDQMLQYQIGLNINDRVFSYKNYIYIYIYITW